MPGTQLRGLFVPGFDVKIEGSTLSAETLAHLLSVTVDDAVDLPSMFTLEFSNSDAARGVLIQDQAQFDVGKVVEVKLGYNDQLTTLMVGEITGLEATYTSDSLPSLIVRGYDRRHRLQRGRKIRTFVKQKDSEIASKIAQEAGLSPQVTDSKVVHDYVLQANQTDMDFLLERAQQIQYEVTVQDKKLLFQPVANAGNAILTLTLEDDLVEFFPRLSSVGQVSEVRVQGWNPQTKDTILGKAQQGAVTSTMGGTKSGAALVASAFSSAVELVSDSPIVTQAEADQVAIALLNARSLALITGEGVCIGHPDLRAGKVIKIDGLGKRFSGQYYVTSVSHRYGESGYATHFTVRRNAS
jgi:phage protein D